MKRALATLAFFLALFSAHAQRTDTAGFDMRFGGIMNAYAKSPEAVDALFDMAMLYFDNSLPMRNLPLAMTFASKAVENYSALVMEDKNHRELTRLLRRGIVLSTLQHLKESVREAALNNVRLNDGLDLVELDAYLEVFADDAEIVGIVRQRRIGLVYDADMKEATPQSYYHIIASYPGTKEAARAEAMLGNAAASLFGNLDNEEAIDSVAALYPASPSVARSAARKKSRLAFTRAMQDNTIAAYKAFLRQYPSSDENQQVRDALDNLLALQYNTLHTAKEYADFADSNADNDLADQALAQIRRIIRDERNVQAARLYLDRYRLDPHYNEVYATYYSWYADEGNGELLARFEEENPDSPLRYALERDQERTLILDNIDLMEPFHEDNFSIYSTNIRQAMGKKLSFVPLQRMLQQLCAAGEYKNAADRVKQFEICYDDVMHDEFVELQAVLSAPAAGLRSIRFTVGGDLLNPCFNAGDNLLYFNRIDGGANRICYATSELEYGGQVEFSSIQSGDLRLFGFYDGGDKMLLGSGGDILIAERDGSAWRVSEIPPFPVNTDFVETDAFMLPDGSGLLLASDRPGGQNLQQSGSYYHGDTALATDLYFIPLRDGRWGTPVNLGTSINTPYCERSPWMSDDMRTLYYVTDSRGMGYGDIYTATLTSLDNWTSWSKPQNMGYEVNSCLSEASVSLGPGEQEMYLSTNAGGQYVCRIVTLRSKPASSHINYSLDVLGMGDTPFRVRVADISLQKVTQVAEYDGHGPAVGIEIHKGKKYAVFGDAVDHFIPAVIVSPTHRPQRMQGYTYPALVSLDKALPLDAVGFEPSQSKLSPVAVMQLEQLARFMVETPAAMAEIDIDVAGLDDELAYTLSLERGGVVKEQLTALGVESRRIIVSAYGNVRTKRGADEGISVQFR